MSNTDTLKALAGMNDTGKFERLATAVLKEENPLYKSLAQTGTNVNGQTVKCPVDGITFICGANPPHIVFAHHTTGLRKGIKRKWLNIPSKKKHAKKSDLGDIHKTIKIYKEEQERIPNLKCTLILPTTVDPPEDVVREANAIATNAGINIDFWPASRIVHFLDIDPNGQYLRNKYFGITQERLSKELLYDLSKKSLDSFPFLDNQAAWIDRDFDRYLENHCRSGVTFVVAESGMGKSVACYKQLKTHINNGGYGLILPHEMLVRANSIEQAIHTLLIDLYPALLNGSGAEALNLSSSKNSILIVVEDLNKSEKKSLLLEKIAYWHNKNKDTNEVSWKILCPVWPRFIELLKDNIREIVNDLVVFCPAFSCATVTILEMKVGPSESIFRN